MDMRKRKGQEKTELAITITSYRSTSHYGKWPNTVIQVPGDIETFNAAFRQWLAKYQGSKTVRLNQSPVQKILKNHAESDYES